MKDLIFSLFGEYIPVTYSVSVPVTASDGSVTVEVYEAVASGLAGCDWTWIAGVALFAIVLLSFFRMVGVLLKHG